jgi:Arc/MetJ-type ribon-helix-helix transcriptional regulator
MSVRMSVTLPEEIETFIERDAKRMAVSKAAVVRMRLTACYREALDRDSSKQSSRSGQDVTDSNHDDSVC